MCESGSESDDDDFASIFTVSKRNASDLLKNDKDPDYLIDETPDKQACAVVENVPPSIAPIPEKRSREECSSIVAESSPILISDEEFEQPARGRGRGRGRGRRQPSRRTSRRNQGVMPHLSQGLNIPAPEFVLNTSKELNWSLDDSTTKDISIDLEEDNYEISVKVCWKSTTVTPFMIRKYQKLTTIFEFYANQEGITSNQIQLTLGDRIISPNDSPDSLSLTVANILEGGIMTTAANSKATTETPRAASPVDKNSILLKVRHKDSKEPALIRIKKTQKMLVLMTKYAEQYELPIQKLKFSFDGELISPNDTPTDLDLEGDEMIELTITA